jgi:hypothetical protein
MILLPPRELTSKENANYMTPEPIVFYYYTGMRSKWANMPGAEKCAYAIVVRNGQLEMATFRPGEINAIIKEYKKYNISL